MKERDNLGNLDINRRRRETKLEAIPQATRWFKYDRD